MVDGWGEMVQRVGGQGWAGRGVRKVRAGQEAERDDDQGRERIGRMNCLTEGEY